MVRKNFTSLWIALAFAMAIGIAVPTLAAQSARSTYLARAMPHIAAAIASNFALLRGKRTEADQFSDTYAVRRLSLASATIDHVFAAPSQREYWEFFFVQPLPPTTTAVQASNIAAKELTPALKHFSPIGALDRTGATIWTWTGANGERVVATPFAEPASAGKPATAGFSVSVRHFITKHPRVALYAHGMTPAQRKGLFAALARELRVGMPAAATNFTSLRGRPTHGQDTSPLGTSFAGTYASSFRLGIPYSSCNISAALFHPNTENNDSHWALACTSPEIFGTSLTYDAVQAAVASNLPSNYVTRTNFRTGLATLFDSKRTRWDSPDGSISILLEQRADDTYVGWNIYELSVLHFIPNQ